MYHLQSLVCYSWPLCHWYQGLSRPLCVHVWCRHVVALNSPVTLRCYDSDCPFSSAAWLTGWLALLSTCVARIFLLLRHGCSRPRESARGSCDCAKSGFPQGSRPCGCHVLSVRSVSTHQDELTCAASPVGVDRYTTPAPLLASEPSGVMSTTVECCFFLLSCFNEPKHSIFTTLLFRSTCMHPWNITEHPLLCLVWIKRP